MNISIDTLDEATFREISRRSNVQRVIDGIDSAIRAGFERIKLNTTAVKGITEAQILSLVRFAKERGVQIRFIEFMGLDTDRAWSSDRVLTGAGIREIIEREFGALEPARRTDPAQPATEYRLTDGQSIGVIASVTEPFCDQCNRIRLTADGSIRNCLFSAEDFSIRSALREGATDDEIIARFQQAVSAKLAGHGMGTESFRPPERPMYSIGG